MNSKYFDSLLESPGRLRHAAIDGGRRRVLVELRRRRERVRRLIRLLSEQTPPEEGAGRTDGAASRHRRCSLSTNSPAHAA